MSNRKQRRSRKILDLKQRASAGDELALDELLKLLAARQEAILKKQEHRKAGKRRRKTSADDAFFRRMNGHYGG